MVAGVGLTLGVLPRALRAPALCLASAPDVLSGCQTYALRAVASHQIPPSIKKIRPSKGLFFYGGGSRIRTYEGIANWFTASPV